MSEQYVTKVHRQHTSMVTSIPVQVRIKLGLNKGEHIVWQVSDQCNFVQIFKVVARGESNAADSGNTDRKNKGGKA